MGNSQSAIFNWENKYGSICVFELGKIRQLKERNEQLKMLVTDYSRILLLKFVNLGLVGMITLLILYQKMLICERV